MALFHNRATLSYNGRSVNSNTTTGEIVSVITVAKTAVNDSYSIGDEIVYVITVTNSGSAPASGLSLTDDLGAAGGENAKLEYVQGSLQYYVNGVSSAAPSVTAQAPLSIGEFTVPALGSAMLIYAARVNEYASPEEDGTIVNTATVGGAGMTQVSASETLIARSGAELTITKALSPSSVPENGEITYTFVVSNSGCEEADEDDNITVSDTFSPILHNITVCCDGEAWSEGEDYSYDEQTGVFETMPGNITVPAAAAVQDETTGAWTIESSSVTLIVTGNI